MDNKNKLYGYQGTNPFSDNNGRDFSDEAIQEEFYPTTQFWSLFNNQHEILIGTRGCGKTFLLKAMRRSMLKKIKSPQATEIVENKKYISFYIALKMERMANIEVTDRNNKDRIRLFRFIFNCCLAISIISEAKKHCQELEVLSKQDALILNTNLAENLYKTWFNQKKNDLITDLDDLAVQINSLYFNFNFYTDNIDTIPNLFISDLCAPLNSVDSLLAKFWDADEPTWVLAIDEAEFITELYQKTINSFMRSNPMHVIFKIATLPYYWITLETLHKDIEVSSGNDFNYKLLDMDCDGEDYRILTNKLCSNRLKRVLVEDCPLVVDSLESFLGTIGKDNRIDYFKNEMGGISDKEIQIGILNSISEERRTGSATKDNNLQTIYKKFAPIYYVREVFKKKKGRYIPEWFVGSEVVRKVSQGNPRMFIKLMSQLFSCAITHKDFGLKEQHKEVTKFAHDICESTKAIEKDGEQIYNNLTLIATKLKKKTHDNDLKEVGCSFVFSTKVLLDKEVNWIKRAISFSRLSVDDSAIKNGITRDTKYILCNAFAVEYWLTMRSDFPIKMSLSDIDDENQLSLFSEDQDNE